MNHIKIAICDDEAMIRECLLAWISASDAFASYTLSLSEFASGNELLDAFLARKAYDIVFLDMIMPGLDGLGTAKAIRAIDATALILFLTSSPDFAVQSYHVDAFDYLLKTGDEARMEPVLLKALDTIARREERRVHIKSGNTIHTVKYSEIEYIEIYAKKLSYHLVTSQTLETYKPMRELEEDLADLTQFFKIHRSIVINLTFVTQLNSKFVKTLCGQRLPVTRGRYPELERAFLSLSAAPQKL